jgi:hypothetical protein
MNIFKLAIQLFLLYLLYKFIFDFVIPVYRNAKLMSRKMKEMQQQMYEQQEQYERSASARPQSNAQSKKEESVGEYIDYEEIR